MSNLSDKKIRILKQCVMWGIGATILCIIAVVYFGVKYSAAKKDAEGASEEKTEIARVTTEAPVTETTQAPTTEKTTETTTEATTEEKKYEVDNWDTMPGEVRIVVNSCTNTLTVYKDEKPVKSMICSTGPDTPDGTFYTSDRYRWLFLMGDVYGQYCTTITGNILFHSVPYYYDDIHSLCTEEYNKLGTGCSHGCIRLHAGDAKWIYDQAEYGSIEVNIIEVPDDYGPLGCPPLDELPLDQDFDPTDPEIPDSEKKAAQVGTPGDTE